MKNVNAVRGKDGVLRLYFRKAGFPAVALKSPLPTPGQEAGSALAAEVAAILAGAPAKPVPRTLKRALRVYELDSPDFKNLADSTKASYRGLMKELEDDFGDLDVATFKAPYLLKLRNTWAKRGHRIPGLLLQVLHNALLPAIIAGQLGDGDPFTLIPGIRRPHDLAEPNIVWPEDVVFAVIEAAMTEGRTGLARGVAIGRYAGARRGDIVKLTKAARRGGRFAWLSGKRRVPVDLAEDAVLTAVLDKTPNADNSLILAYNAEGLAYTESGFHQELTKLVARLHKAGKIASDAYTAHGLRHTYGVEGALAGWTDAVGMARMGHSSPSSFAPYRRQADRIRLSDQGGGQVAAFRERTANADVQNDLQKICKTEVGKPIKPRGARRAKSR